MGGQILYALPDALEKTGAAFGRDTAPYCRMKERLHPVRVKDGLIQEWLRLADGREIAHRAGDVLSVTKDTLQKQ